jgi:hypothetical protein
VRPEKDGLPPCRLPLDEPGPGLPPFERLRLLTPRVKEPVEPLLKDDEECADVRSGRSPLLDPPPGTGGAGREGVSEEPFHEAILGRSGVRGCLKWGNAASRPWLSSSKRQCKAICRLLLYDLLSWSRCRAQAVAVADLVKDDESRQLALRNDVSVCRRACTSLYACYPVLFYSIRSCPV